MSAAESSQTIAGVPQPGEVLDGKCRVDGILGVGGMGVVLAATHLPLQRRVAVKLLLPEYSGDVELVARFLQEGRAAARITSEHVAHVHDVATLPNGSPYMVMEYLEGEDLGQVLESRGALPVVEAVDYVLQACEAIAEAHTKGCIHRDLKPSNLFLSRRADGSICVKVLDFGISKLLHEAGSDAAPAMNITKSRSILGSPAYMSPEQLRASKHVDARADVWALGVILFELVSGALPFDGQTVAELGAQVLAGEVPPLRSRHPAPGELAAVVGRCLEKDRDRRFENVPELARALAPFGSADAQSSAARILSTSIRPPSDPEIASRPRLSRPAVDSHAATVDRTEPALADTQPNVPSQTHRLHPSATPVGNAAASVPAMPSAASAPSRRTGAIVAVIAIVLLVGASGAALVARSVRRTAQVTSTSEPSATPSITPAATGETSAVVSPASAPSTSAAMIASSAPTPSASDRRGAHSGRRPGKSTQGASPVSPPPPSAAVTPTSTPPAAPSKPADDRFE